MIEAGTYPSRPGIAACTTCLPHCPLPASFHPWTASGRSPNAYSCVIATAGNLPCQAFLAERSKSSLSFSSSVFSFFAWHSASLWFEVFASHLSKPSSSLALRQPSLRASSFRAFRTCRCPSQQRTRPPEPGSGARPLSRHSPQPNPCPAHSTGEQPACQSVS